MGSPENIDHIVFIFSQTSGDTVASKTYTLKMLGCFNPILGQIWTNPNVGLKI